MHLNKKIWFQWLFPWKSYFNYNNYIAIITILTVDYCLFSMQFEHLFNQGIKCNYESETNKVW